MAGGSRTPIFGPEPWTEQAGQCWSHWDLWFCLVAVLDFHGDLSALAEAIYARARLDRDWEARVSHLDDLRGRLDAVGLAATELVMPRIADARTRAKARRKVLAQGLSAQDFTEPMRNTPSRRLRARALHGWWSEFPVDPAPYRDRIAERALARLAQGWGGARMTREVGQTVEAQRRALAGNVAAERALLRAAVTAGEEVFDAGLRDSDGEFAGWCGMTLVAYAALPRSDDGRESDVYLHDLCGFWVWEHYAFAYRCEREVFVGVRPQDMDRVEVIFLELHDEHRRARLDFPAEQAIEGLAWASIATGDLSRMPSVSARLGSDHHIATRAMVDVAAKAGRLDLAHAIFDGADVPGGHRDFLQEQRKKMLPPRSNRLWVVR